MFNFYSNFNMHLKTFSKSKLSPTQNDLVFFAM